MLLSLSGCSLIDDDMDDCATSRTVDCRVHVSTVVDSLLSTQIHGEGTGALRSGLSAYYQDLLQKSTRNIRFQFYDAATGELCSTESRSIPGNEATLSIDLPEGDLRCLAVSPDDPSTATDSLLAFSDPLYSGRSLMPQGQSHYSVHLYPVDAQVALAARIDSTITAVSVSVEQCARSFAVSDSTYSYSAGYSRQLPLLSSVSTAPFRTYAAAVMPSVSGSSRADASSAEPWQVVILATTAAGPVTRTVLTVSKPLLPGDIRVLLVSIGADGVTRTTDSSVGATVTLDWKQGGDYHHDI